MSEDGVNVPTLEAFLDLKKDFQIFKEQIGQVPSKGELLELKARLQTLIASMKASLEVLVTAIEELEGGV